MLIYFVFRSARSLITEQKFMSDRKWYFFSTLTTLTLSLVSVWFRKCFKNCHYKNTSSCRSAQQRNFLQTIPPSQLDLGKLWFNYVRCKDYGQEMNTDRTLPSHNQSRMYYNLISASSQCTCRFKHSKKGTTFKFI